MITPTNMYWITRLDAFHYVFYIILVISSLVGILHLFIFLTGKFEGRDRPAGIARKVATVSGVVVAISFVLWILTPTAKEMAAIYIVPKVVNSEKVQEAGNKLYALAVEWMDELKPSKK